MRWILAAALILSGCSSLLRPDRGAFDRLNGRGRVPVSPDNQYMAANLLLARESERRPEFKGILQTLGTPEEIEVLQDSPVSPYRIKLYYLSKHRAYEAIDSGDLWLLSEGKSLNSPVFKESETTVKIYDRTAKFEPRKELAPQADQVAERIQADPRLGKLKHIITNTPPNEIRKTEYGHYLHVVAFPKLTIKTIALWHTMEFGNGEKLARINNMPIDTPLALGAKVRIPSYLMQNPKALSAESYGELMEMLGGQ